MPKPGQPLPGMPTPGAANKLTGALGKLGLAVGGLMIARKGIIALKEHSTEMAQVGLMAGKTGEDLRDLGHDILDLSVKYGKGASDMRTAAYEVYSAQVPATQALKVLEQSTQAAMAGNAGVTESFRLMSSVIKGYGKDWSEVGDVSDHVFKIIEQGQTTMGDLAGSMGRAVPMAKAMGVSLTELSGFYATFTGVTGDAALVTTQMVGTMTAFAKPTEAMTKLANDLGYATAEEIVQQNGLDKALKLVVGSTDGSATAIGKLIPRIRAMPLVLAATGGQADVLTDKIGKMNDRFGATGKAVKEVQKSIGQRMAEMKASLEATLIKVFEALEPIIGGIVAAISGFLGIVSKINDFLPTTSVIMTGLIAVIGAVITVIMSGLVPALQAAIASAAAFMATPIGAILGVIALAAVAAGLAFDALKDKTLENAQANVKAMETERAQLQTLLKSKTAAADLAAEYVKLAKKKNKSAAETARMNSLYNKIGKAYPKLVSGTRNWDDRLGEMNKVVKNSQGELDKLNERLLENEKILARERMTVAMEKAKKASKSYSAAILAYWKEQAQGYEDSVRREVEAATDNLSRQKSAASQIMALDDERIRQSQLMKAASDDGRKKDAANAREKINYLAGIIDKLQEAEVEQEKLNKIDLTPDEQIKKLQALTEELKAYGVELELTGSLTSQIAATEEALSQAREDMQTKADEQAAARAANAEKDAEFLAAEAEATEEMVSMKYEAGETTLAQYVAHLQAKLNAMGSANAQEVLARMQVQKQIDDLNAEGLAKEQARWDKELAAEQGIWNLRIAMETNADKKIMDAAVANENLTAAEKIKAGDLYWSNRILQTVTGVEAEGLAETQAKEKTDLLLQQLGIKRAEWEQAQRDADVTADELAEQKKRDAKKAVYAQAFQTAQAIGDSIASLYESQKQRQIAAVKKLGLSEEEEKKRLAKIEVDFAKKQKTAATIQKSVKVAQAISNTALGVTQALKTFPPPWSFAMAALVGAAGAAQVAAIVAQPFERGGILRAGDTGFFEGKRDELVMPLQGEGSFEEIAKLRLIPEILKGISSPGAGGGSTAPAPIVQNITNNQNWNGPVLSSDAEAVAEWERAGAKYQADKIKEANESLG